MMKLKSTKKTHAKPIKKSDEQISSSKRYKKHAVQRIPPSGKSKSMSDKYPSFMDASDSPLDSDDAPDESHQKPIDRS